MNKGIDCYINCYIFNRYNKPPSNSSPPRPSTLPISEPKPVPTTRRFQRLQSPPKVRKVNKLFGCKNLNGLYYFRTLLITTVAFHDQHLLI